MVHSCTERTDLEELIGKETWEDRQTRFRYGPLTLAMKNGEELILENSKCLSSFTKAKIAAVIDRLFIEDTCEAICAKQGFRLTLR